MIIPAELKLGPASYLLIVSFVWPGQGSPKTLKAGHPKLSSFGEERLSLSGL